MAPASTPGDEGLLRLRTAALSLGISAQLAQILVFREVMAVCHGSEILFGIVLASGLGWTALGSAAMTRLARRAGEAGAEQARGLFAALAPAAGLLLAGEVLLARSLAGWGSEAAGQAIPLSRSAALALIVTGPVAVLCGALFALALRILPAHRFGTAYRAESVGAMCGGLAFTFVLVHIVGPMRAAFLLGALFGAAAIAAMRPFSRRLRAVSLAASIVSLAGAVLPAEGFAERMKWRLALPGYELLEFRDTPYGRACALRRAGSSQVSLYHNGALVASVEPDVPVTESRHIADLCACLHPAPKRLLLVGGALGPLAEQFLRHGVQSVDAVELDPALFELAEAHAGLRRGDGRIRRIAADGRYFVKRAAPGSYDLVIVLAGEPDSATVNRYYTAEFFAEVMDVLSAEGILAIFVPTYGGSVEYTGESLARRSGSIWRALGEASLNRRAAPVGGHLLIAGKGRDRVSLLPERLGERLAGRPDALPEMIVTSGGRDEAIKVPPADYFGALFGGVLAARVSLDGGERQDYIDKLEETLSKARCDVNRDARPAAVVESLVLGAEVMAPGRGSATGSAGPGLAGMLRSWGPPTAFVPGIAALAVALAAVVRRRGSGRCGGPRSALLLCAAATGLFGMAIEVGLLGSYQNVRGYVYSEIGGLVASFMAGLALGALLGERLKGRPRAGLAALTVAMIVLAAAAPWIVSRLSGLQDGRLAAAGFWAMIVVAGLLDGASFPVLVACGGGGGDERFGGWVYASDLAGAAVGALFCGAVWIPLLGLGWAMIAVVAVLAAALLSVTSLGTEMASPS